MKKKLSGLLAALIAAQVMAVGVSADVIKSDNGIRFQLEDGRYASGWVTKDEKTYYFDKEGYALLGWYKINDETYYFDHNSVMADGLYEVSDVTRYFKDGKLVKGAFVETDGKTYYVSTSGRVAKGWRKLNGTYYHFNEEGVMDTGWTKLNGTYYYFGSDGKMCTSTVTIKDKEYKFASNGKYIGQVTDDVETSVEPEKETPKEEATPVTPKPTPKPEKEETTVETSNWDEATMGTPQTTMMIQMVENYTQTKLADAKKEAMYKYVTEKIREAKQKGSIDAAWYTTFIDGAFEAVGTEFPAEKRASLVAKLKQQDEDDFKTIYTELIK